MSIDLDFDRCYRAVTSRDARFDGQFFTAVRTTGIYCRPSCPAVTPKPQNVSFMHTAAAAQSSGYRACRRCLPDATPGSPLWNVRSDLAARAMRLITDGLVERGGVDALSANLGYSTRQITRVLTNEVGAGPLALARAHRAHTARQLIQTTTMTMADISFAAGFASIRQFNDTVREVFAATPSALRGKGLREPAGPSRAEGTLTLRLPYRSPLNTPWLEWFLGGNAVPGMESFDNGEYRRSILLPHGHAIMSLRVHPGYVLAALNLSDMRDLSSAVARIRQLLDLDADPVAVDTALAADPLLASNVLAHPGIRVPGSMDGPELLLRTIIGQQISLGAAVTHTARLVAALGDPIVDPLPGSTITHLFPDAAAIAERGHEILTGPAARVRSVCAAAAVIAEGGIELHSARVPAELESELLALKGVGPWTARYVSMRQLSDPDVLLDTDLVVRQGARGLGLDLAASERWAPWRSYVSMHLWRYALEARQVTKEIAKGRKAS